MNSKHNLSKKTAWLIPSIQSANGAIRVIFIKSAGPKHVSHGWLIKLLQVIHFYGLLHDYLGVSVLHSLEHWCVSFYTHFLSHHLSYHSTAMNTSMTIYIFLLSLSFFLCSLPSFRFIFKFTEYSKAIIQTYDNSNKMSYDKNQHDCDQKVLELFQI